MDKISVIVPCKNEEASLPYFFEEMQKVANSKEAKKITFEFLFIDDGSTDRTLELFRQFHKQDKRVRYLSFSRNFKKEAANYAGLKEATGDYAVIIDADLQHPPRLILKMYQILKEEDYDCVAGRRKNRKGENLIHSFFSHCFYKIMNAISSTEFVDGATDFCLMNRKMRETIVNMGEYNRFSKGIFGWVGFKTKWIEFSNVKRVAGKSTFHFTTLFQYAMESIVSFSNFPLYISFILGGITFAFSLILGLILLIQCIVGTSIAAVYGLLLVILLLASLQFFCFGILGLYLSRTYLETKHRPIYVIRETEKDVKN